MTDAFCGLLKSYIVSVGIRRTTTHLIISLLTLIVIKLIICSVILRDQRSRFTTEQCRAGPCDHRCFSWSWSCDTYHRSSLTSFSGQSLDVFECLCLLVCVGLVWKSLMKSPECFIPRNFRVLWQFWVSEKWKCLHKESRYLLWLWFCWRRSFLHSFMF